MPKIRKARSNNRTNKKKPTKKKKSTAEGIIARIGSVRDYIEEGMTFNMYGLSGTGKTTLWSTFPKPILAVLCSGGTRPGELRSLDYDDPENIIDAVVLEKTEELEELARYVEEKQQYKTVVVDHLTGLQDLRLKEILGLDEIPAQKSWGLATQQEWGQVSLTVKELLRSLLGTSCIKVLIAQERAFNVDTENELLAPYVASALSPSLTGWINQASDCICQTFIRQKTKEKKVKVGKRTVVKRIPTEGVEYCLRTGPHETYMTKFRKPRGNELPEVIVDPSYEKIARLLKGG